MSKARASAAKSFREYNDKPLVAKQFTYDGRDDDEEEKVENRPHLVSPSPKRKARPYQDSSYLEKKKEETQARRDVNRRSSRSKQQVVYQELDTEDDEEAQSRGATHVSRSKTAPSSRKKARRDIEENGYLICTFADILTFKPKDRLVYENILLCRSDKVFPTSSTKCVKDGVAVGCGFCIPHQTPYKSGNKRDQDYRLVTPKNIAHVPFRANELMKKHWATNRCGRVPMQVVESAKEKYKYQFCRDTLADGLKEMGMEDDVAFGKVKIRAKRTFVGRIRKGI